MVQNFPYEHRPRSWADVAYQPVVQTIMQSWLQRSMFPSFVFCQGPSGVGKSSTIKLLIQTTHCLNRPAHSVDPCGTCAVCQADPQLTTGYTNVIWVNAGASKDAEGEEITYERAIKDALARADNGPITTGAGNRHRDILFVVFEEAHLMPKQYFQRCLAKADTVNPYATEVVYVFITMSPDDISSTARQAISQRGAILNFNAPTTAELAQLLLNKFDDLTPGVAELIAAAAGNSIRGALSGYKDCLDYQQPITLQSAAQRLRFIDPSSRYQLWCLLKDQTKGKSFHTICESLLQGIEPRYLARALLQDLDESYELLGEAIWWQASLVLNEFMRRPDSLNLAYSLHVLKGIEWPAQFPPIKGIEFRLPYDEWMHKAWPTLYS